MGNRGAAVGAGLLLAVAACGGEPAPRPSASAPAISSPPSASAAASASASPCTEPAGQVDAPGDGYRVVAAVVAVPTDRVLRVATSGEPAAELFAKWGLLVRTGETAEVSAESGPALIGWGSSAVPAASVRITACREGSRPWTAFAGGTWLNEPACVPLLIRAGGRSQHVRLPIGAPCD
jgi:hypothetical protein